MTPAQQRLFQGVDEAERLLGRARLVVATSDLGAVDFGRFVGVLPAVYSLLKGSDAKRQMQGVLDQVSGTLEQLSTAGRLGQKLLKGEVTPQAFAEVLNAAGGAIVAVMREADAASYSAGNLWNAVVVPTVGETKELVEQVADRGQSLGTIAAVIAVAVAVIYLTSKVAR